jgi:hypothetical protein
MDAFPLVRHDFRGWTGRDPVVIVRGMGKVDVLDRVTADLACGHTTPAIRRLSSLVAAYPTDLDLRQRLAAAHRSVGNLVQAGRWGYLHADAHPAETAAFERAYPSVARRLRELRWPARGQAATDFARGRLAALGADRVTAPATRPAGRLRLDRRLTLALLVSAPFAVLGAITVVQWLMG